MEVQANGDTDRKDGDRKYGTETGGCKAWKSRKNYDGKSKNGEVR